MPARIMIVEDNEDLAGLAKATLERNGYLVAHRITGPTALGTILADPPDLLILDVKLPTITGFEVLRELRSMPQTADLPVIMVTALNTPADKAKAKELGAADYIVKPYMPSQLIDAVKRHLPSP